MKRALLLLALVPALCVPVCAAGLSDALGIPNVAAAAPAEAAEAVGNPAPGDADPDRGLSALLDSLRAHFPDALREALRPLAGMLAVTVLCAAAEAFAVGSGAAETIAFGGCLAIALIGAEDVHSALQLGRETLAKLSEFSAVLLPTLTSAAAVSGAPNAAGAVWAGAALFSDLLLRASETLILPLICGFVAAAAASAVIGDARLDGAVKLLQWSARTALRALALCFTGYLAVTRALGAAADAATVKTAKTLLSVSLPVVGKLLADASEALVAGAGLLRASVGVYGLLITLAVVLLPVLRLALRVLLFRAAAAVCAGVAPPRLTRLIGLLGSAYSLLLGLVGAAAAIGFLSIISLIRTVIP